MIFDLCADIRDLISVDDVLEDEDIIMGPNGGLVFCMESVKGYEYTNIYDIVQTGIIVRPIETRYLWNGVKRKSTD